MRKAYSTAQKREAVAQARVLGVEAAAASLRIDPRTIRGWLEQAGYPPELQGNAAAWQRAFDLAHAKVEGFLASGKASAVTAATIMGIAQRNMRDLERDQRQAESTDETPSDVKAAVDEFEAIVAQRFPGADFGVVIQVLLANDRLTGRDGNPYAACDCPEHVGLRDETQPEEEPGEESGEESGEETVARWLADLDNLVKEHGSVEAVLAWQRAEDHRLLEEQLAKNQANADAAMASARQAMWDNETAALIQEAERYLRESADA